MNYIELKGPVMATDKNIILIYTSDDQIISKIIEYSEVLNLNNTTISTSYESIEVVFDEIKKYFLDHFIANAFEIIDAQNCIKW